ncbi:uncharacterized protein LOC134177329 [Corticium candelabrum]|uniref:uncharacterized protein LOC134177329 n=1 Tax=Corticium candelabrum TaxID=121492 RepID=UPI002E255DB7|nr:uncharacterized protein LOC134177329 [Corticium candelabrum]
MESCGGSSGLKRLYRPPPETIRFSEGVLSDKLRFKKRKEVQEEQHQSQKLKKLNLLEDGKIGQNESSGRVTSSEYKKTMHRVQEIAAELIDQKPFKPLSVKLQNSKSPRKIKLPYPNLMHIRKLEKERQKKAKELDLLSQSLTPKRKRKKALSEMRRFDFLSLFW